MVYEQKLLNNNFTANMLEYVTKLKDQFEHYLTNEQKMENLLKRLLTSTEKLYVQKEIDNGFKMTSLATSVAEKLVQDLQKFNEKIEQSERIKQEYLKSKAYSKMQKTIKSYNKMVSAFNSNCMQKKVTNEIK